MSVCVCVCAGLDIAVFSYQWHEGELGDQTGDRSHGSLQSSLHLLQISLTTHGDVSQAHQYYHNGREHCRQGTLRSLHHHVHRILSDVPAFIIGRTLYCIAELRPFEEFVYKHMHFGTS